MHTLRYLTVACVLAGCNTSSESASTSAAQATPASETQVDPTKAQQALAAAQELAHQGQPSGMPPGHPPVNPGQRPPGQMPMGATQPSSGEVPPNAAGGIEWKVEAPLVAQVPQSRMRAAEYKVEGDGSTAEAVLTVFYFGPGQGGSVQANLDRWVDQFVQPDGTSSREAARVENQEIAGMMVKTVDLEGSFNGGMGPMMQGSGEPQPGFRVLGAIASGPEGPVFFKLLGPKATVDKAEAAFLTLIQSIHPS